MIYGIGTDLCDIRRIRETLARRGERFAEKVLGPHELAVFRARRARVAVRTGADRISSSNSACHTRRARASVAGLRTFTFEPMQCCEPMSLTDRPDA